MGYEHDPKKAKKYPYVINAPKFLCEKAYNSNKYETTQYQTN